MTDLVCRLCLTTRDLVWIFDSRIAEPGNMKEVIQITTGIEIKSTDKVTQKVCKKCCQITIKMFKFRASALKNDKELKDRLLELELKTETNMSPQAGQTEHTPNTVVEEFTTSLRHNAAINSTEKPVNHESAKKPSGITSCNKPHDTVTELLHKYPQLKIPRSCLKCNLFPTVAIDCDEVATWLTKKRKRDQAKEAEDRKVKNKPSPTKTPVNVTQGPNFGIDQSVVKSSNKKMPKLLSEMTAAKRKMSSDTLKPKRKLSLDTMSSCSSDPDRDALFSHPDSAAREMFSYGGEPELLSHINKSTNVNVCTICNAVTYNYRELKLHSRKHTVCPFCKVRFRTMEAKNSHVGNECPIKSIMQNIPTIPLIRVDQVKVLTEKYPNAFDYIQVVSSDEEDGGDNVEALITDHSHDPLAMDVENKATSGQAERVEGAVTVDSSKSLDLPAICIPKNNSNNNAVEIGQNDESIEYIDITVDDDVLYISDDEVGSESPKDHKVDTDKPRTSENHSPQSNLHQSQLAMELLRNDTKETASEPATKLKNVEADPATKVPGKCSTKLPSFDMSNDPFIDVVNATDKEVNLLRMLLQKADMCPGLLPPTNKSIIIQGVTDKIYALTNILHYLRKYKMPVDLSFNNKLTVAYEPVKPSHPSKVEIWDPNMALPQRNMIPQPVVNDKNTTFHPPCESKYVNLSNSLPKPPAAAENKTGIQLSTSNPPVTGIPCPTNSSPATGIKRPSNRTPVTGIKFSTNSRPVTGIQHPRNGIPATRIQLPTNNTPLGFHNPTDITPVTCNQLPTISTPITANNVSSIVNIQNRNQITADHTSAHGQNMSPVPSYNIQMAHVTDASGPPNATSTNNRTKVLNPLLNEALNRPITDNRVYNSPNVGTLVASGIFTSGGCTNPSNIRAVSGDNSYSHSPATAREVNILPKILPPPPSYTPSPPHYRPHSLQRIEDRSLGVRGAGLRVKTAAELNQKF